MKNSYIYDRDFYCIGICGKEKTFTYFGYSYLENEYRCIDCEIREKLSVVLDYGIKDWIEDQTQTIPMYITDFNNGEEAKDFIEHFFYDYNNPEDETLLNAGEEKSLDDVDMDTPCGNYWSRF